LATVLLTINGQPIDARPGESIIKAAKRHNIDIPNLCQDPRTKAAGDCGLCVVELAGTDKPVKSCSMQVEAGMSVTTESERLSEIRRARLNSYLENHNAYCQPPCQYGCPAGTKVAGYVRLIGEGNFAAATSLIKENIPLPGVLGRVCPAPCEAVCRRGQVDKPIAICTLKRFAADQAMALGLKTHPDPKPDTGKRVAVIGGGPAGLAAAFYLRLEGHTVTIYEAQEKAGGYLQYGIPAYRLPKDLVDKEIQEILDTGIALKTHTALGRDYQISDLKAAGYDAVFLGIGASLGKTSGLKGEESHGVFSAVGFLAEVNRGQRTTIGQRVAVIGGGFTAADCARTARRLGAKQVSLIYRRSREEMPASPHEIHECEVEGVKLELQTAPVAINHNADGDLVSLTCQRMAMGEPDESGRRRPQPVKGSEFDIEIDNLMLAIGQDVDLDKAIEDLQRTPWNSIQVNESTMLTNIEGVFSGGDCVTGAATVVEAIGGAKKAVRAMNAFLASGDQRAMAEAAADQHPTLFDIGAKPKHAEYDRIDQGVLDGRTRAKSFGIEVRPGSLGADKADGAFEEVDRGFTKEQAIAEAKRCLECVCQEAGRCTLQKNSIRYGAGTTSFRGLKKFAPLTAFPFFEMNREKCIQCHNCIRVCDQVQFRKVYTKGEDGFPALVSGTTDYADTECNHCGLCVSACPTGALKDLSDKGTLRPDQRRTTNTTCVYCGVGCALTLESEGQQIVKVENAFNSDANRGSLCVKGRFGFDFINSPDRLITPLIRRGGKGAPLEAATWEEAITVVARRLGEVKNKYGPNALGGLNSSKVTNEDNYIFQKFVRTALGTNNLDHCARLCHVASGEALGKTLGGGSMSASNLDVRAADCIIVIGSNTTQTHPVIASLALQAKYQDGAKIITIDPRRIEMAGHSDIWLRNSIGTNVAVLNGMANVIIAEGMVDEVFIAERTEGFEAMKSVVKKYTPEYVERLSGVPAQNIIDAAHAYAQARRGIILWGMGITQHLTGVEAACGLVNLALMTGHIGRTGTGVMPLRGQNNVQGASDMGQPDKLPGHQLIKDPEVIGKFQQAWGRELPREDGLTVVEMEAAAGDSIKAMYIQGENPMMSSPDINHVRHGLESLEFLVVQDIFLTETAALADVVLPATTFAEKLGTFTNTERRVQLVRPAIAPISEARGDWEIICDISTAMGYPMHYDSSAQIMEEIASLVPAYAGIRYDRLEAGGIMWPCPDTEHPGTRILYSETFPLGKGRFTALEYTEHNGEKPEDEFPLLLSTGRLLEHYHTGTMSRRASKLDQAVPEVGLQMTAEDARRYGTENGELIRLVTKRGSIEVKVEISDLPQQGVVFLPFHFAEAAANRLTSSKFDPASKTPAYKQSAARIEKIAV
jgi:formate dehydrogenase major subunit